MTARCNGHDVLRAEITEPRVGAWTAELELDANEAITGRVTLEIDGVTWIGTVQRGSLVQGRYSAMVVGGNGALSKPLPAKHYMNGTMAAWLREALAPAGETLSPTSESAITNQSMARWSRRRGTVGAAVAQVARESGDASWRVLRDGSVWIGVERWPAATAKYDEIEDVPDLGYMIAVAEEGPSIAPGMTFAGKRVASVVTTLDGNGALRQRVNFEDPDSPGGGTERFQGVVAGVIESVVGWRIDYGRLYPAKVIAQNGDGSLELYPDDELVRGSGISQVPIRHGLPGVTVKVNAGARVALFFENGDPKKPAVALWPDGSSCKEISIKAPDLKLEGNLTVTGDITATGNVTATGEVTTKKLGAPVNLSTHKHPTAMGPSGPPLPG
jgi:hypothetical protein